MRFGRDGRGAFLHKMALGWTPLLMLVAGCSGFSLDGIRLFKTARSQVAAHEQPAEGMGTDVLRGPAAPASFVSEAIHVIHLRFDVHRVDIPISAVRHTQKVWGHLDELRLDPAHTALLARNALRVGVGKEGAWPAIRAILSSVKLKESRAQRLVRAGAPLTIKLSQIESPEALFRYGPDAVLVGGTLERGYKTICLEYEWSPRQRSRTTVSLSFEVMENPDRREWDVITGADTGAGEAVVFGDLSCTFALDDGEFVVIGVSDALSNRFLLGSRFLTSEVGGRRYETLLFITPQPMRTTIDAR